MLWWEGNQRRRTSTGTADRAAAERLLSEFVAGGSFRSFAESRRRGLRRATTIYVISAQPPGVAGSASSPKREAIAAGQQKIGVSHAPAERLATLQRSHSHKLVLVRQWTVEESQAAVVEKRAHRLLAERRLQGEWFDVSAEVACAAVCVALAVDPYSSSADIAPRR